MNKKVLFAATVAAVLASCSSDDLSVQTAAKQEAQGLENAVSFEAYSQRSLTRAGYAGAMDNDKLKTEGFGVFGYYTDMNEYDQTSTPNFMYNQKVSGAGWTYEPVKYWPNEYGNKAQSDDVDKLSFFAYAPYVENTPSTGKVEAGEDLVGITGFTRNTAAGDPYVKYVGSLDPTKCVDLCWGVVDPSADQDWNIINGGIQRMSAGMPWLNVQRPQKSLGQKMKFTFKHALSQLNVQIDADVNTNQHGQGADLDANTKVFVRSITFNGFAMKGALNLNNEEAGTPNWKGYNCSNEPLQSEEYTVYDGMKDGKEGTGYTASNEKVTGLNEKIIQDKAWNQSAEGVTKTAKNLFNSETVDAPIYVIPTGDDMTVTIVYDIETKDANLAGTVSDLETAGVSIENKITKTITLTSADAMKLEAGKKYTIQLHLGLSQVEFDATVSDWADGASGEAWLPENGEAVPVPTLSTATSADVGKQFLNLTAPVDAGIFIESRPLVFPEGGNKASDRLPAWPDALLRGADGFHQRVDGPQAAVPVKTQPAASLQLIGRQPLLGREHRDQQIGADPALRKQLGTCHHGFCGLTQGRGFEDLFQILENTAVFRRTGTKTLQDLLCRHLPLALPGGADDQVKRQRMLPGRVGNCPQGLFRIFRKGVLQKMKD